MTLLQAMERIPWERMSVDSVLRRDLGQLLVAGLPTTPRLCEVCDGEFSTRAFVVVWDTEECTSYYIDVGPRCERDLEAGLKRGGLRSRRNGGRND